MLVKKMSFTNLYNRTKNNNLSKEKKERADLKRRVKNSKMWNVSLILLNLVSILQLYQKFLLKKMINKSLITNLKLNWVPNSLLREVLLWLNSKTLKNYFSCWLTLEKYNATKPSKHFKEILYSTLFKENPKTSLPHFILSLTCMTPYKF